MEVSKAQYGGSQIQFVWGLRFQEPFFRVGLINYIPQNMLLILYFPYYNYIEHLYHFVVRQLVYIGHLHSVYAFWCVVV